MLNVITLHTIRANVRDSAAPLLVACVHAHADTTPHIRALEQVAGAFGPQVNVCLLRERRPASLKDRLGIDGTPVYLLFRNNREVWRMLGEADARTLIVRLQHTLSAVLLCEPA